MRRRAITAVLGALLLLSAGHVLSRDASGGPAARPPGILSAPGTRDDQPTDPDSLRIRDILFNANKYALTTWWTDKRYEAQPSPYLDFGGTKARYIRPPASVAYSLAVSLATGVYDPARTGVPLDEARAKALKLAVSVAYRHRSNQQGGWGADWQTALWAAFAGTAGWLMWADIAPQDQANIQRMVRSEARRLIGYQVPYYRDRRGDIISPGDSKAEENAWNTTILQLATALLRGDPQSDGWMYKSLELSVSAFSRPSDVTSRRAVNGRRLSAWLRGSNANEDGTVVNHRRIHPDYMVSHALSMMGALAASLDGRPTPRAALFNGDIVYDALVDLPFSSPPYDPPGGTIYIVDSPHIYYPEGNDWGTGRRMNFALMDLQARAFSLDGLASRPGSYWEPLHAQMVLDMQNRHPDGRTYGAPDEDKYSGREEWVAEKAGRAYLTKWLMHHDRFSVTDQNYPLVVDNRDVEFTALSGNWRRRTGDETVFGRDYVTASGSDGESVVGFRLVTEPADYKVYVWWPRRIGLAGNAPFTVIHKNGRTTIRVDQSRHGGQWNLLGKFRLAAGRKGSVELSDDANGPVAADAVKVVRVPPR